MVCLACGHVMAFTDDLRLRELTDLERAEAAHDFNILRLQMRVISEGKRWILPLCVALVFLAMALWKLLQPEN